MYFQRGKFYLKWQEEWQETFLKAGMVECHLPEGAMQGVDKEGLQIFFTSELRFFSKEKLHENQEP